LESERSKPPDAALEVVGSVIMTVVVVVVVVAAAPVYAATVEVAVENGAAEVLESISLPICSLKALSQQFDPLALQHQWSLLISGHGRT
jgi:hypothetical protein